MIEDSIAVDLSILLRLCLSMLAVDLVVFLSEGGCWWVLVVVCYADALIVYRLNQSLTQSTSLTRIFPFLFGRKHADIIT